MSVRMDALGKTARGAFLRGESAGNTGQNDRAQTLESAKGKGDLTASRALPRGAAEKAGTFRKVARTSTKRLPLGGRGRAKMHTVRAWS